MRIARPCWSARLRISASFMPAGRVGLHVRNVVCDGHGHPQGTPLTLPTREPSLVLPAGLPILPPIAQVRDKKLIASATTGRPDAQSRRGDRDGRRTPSSRSGKAKPMGASPARSGALRRYALRHPASACAALVGCAFGLLDVVARKPWVVLAPRLGCLPLQQ